MRTYLQEYDIQSQGEATDFEKFANYCVFLPHQTSEDPFDVDTVHTGKANDTGLDGIGILVNGILVNNQDDVDQEAGRGRTLEVRFVFLQAKIENKFSSDVVMRTTDAVVDFFANYLDKKSLYRRTTKVEEKANLAKYLLDKYNKSIRDRPMASIYYITNSRPSPSLTVENQINSKVKRLKEDLSFLKDAHFFAWGCSEIEKLYRRTKLQVEATVNLESVLELSNSIQGVGQAYMATLNFSEFRKIIIDSDDQIMSFIFYDNIRGFLGENNKVNSAIKMTLESEKRNRFSILNNGVTIIAKEIRPEKINTLRLVDYQIVNGCQTSYVLFHSRNFSDIDKILIPVKIIETDDDEIRNDIVKATNYQSEVPKELLLALSEFPKRLESYYDEVQGSSDKRRFYYERRPGQYHANESVIKKRVVGIGNQIKTFAAMFLDEPHNARYKQNLIDKIGKDIFSKQHEPIPYYTSSLASYELENLFSKKLLPTAHKGDIKYHILMVFKYKVGGSECPKCSDSKKINQYCQKIIDILRNPEECKNSFEEARKLVEAQAVEYNNIFNNGLDIDYRNFFKKTAFTKHLLRFLKTKNYNLGSSKQSSIEPSSQLDLPID
jgi:hypothetical protein